MKPSQAAATSLLVPAGPPEPFDLQSAYASVAVAEANLPRAERRKADGSGGRGFRTGFFLFELKCNDQLQAVNHGCGPSRVPGTEHLELAVLVRESVDKGHAPGQRPALGGLAGQAALAGQMAARLSGHGALRHVSVEVVSTEFNQPEERKALQAAIEYAAQRGHALLLPAVSRLARDAKHIFEAVQRVTAAGGRVFVAVSAASLAAGPAGELLQRLVATAVAGRVGLGQTAATWRLGDRVLAVAASNPPRLQAVRELLAASLPDGVLVVCAARCSPTPDEDDNDSSLLRQLECAALVAGELRQTSMRLFGRDDGRSTTDSFDELPLKRRMDEAVAAELLKRTTSPAPMIVVLAWGFERLGRSIVQLRELAVYGAGLAIPVHLACCVPPRSLLDGLSPRRQIDVSLADAPSPPTLEMCTKLEALLAQPPSAGAPDLANLLPIFVGTKTLRLPKCAASPSARVLFLSRRSQPPPPPATGSRSTWPWPRRSSGSAPTTPTCRAWRPSTTPSAAPSSSSATSCRRRRSTGSSPPLPAACGWAGSRSQRQRHRRRRPPPPRRPARGARQRTSPTPAPAAGGLWPGSIRGGVARRKWDAGRPSERPWHLCRDAGSQRRPQRAVLGVRARLLLPLQQRSRGRSLPDALCRVAAVRSRGTGDPRRLVAPRPRAVDEPQEVARASEAKGAPVVALWVVSDSLG